MVLRYLISRSDFALYFHSHPRGSLRAASSSADEVPEGRGTRAYGLVGLASVMRAREIPLFGRGMPFGAEVLMF